MINDRYPQTRGLLEWLNDFSDHATIFPMSTFVLAAKDLRLLLRDAHSAIILLIMPLLFMAVLGMAVGEGFGQKPDDRLRISIVNLDEGLPEEPREYPKKKWSEVVIDDLASTADIRLEIIPNLTEAE